MAGNLARLAADAQRGVGEEANGVGHDRVPLATAA
jgi:hypothetical protein